MPSRKTDLLSNARKCGNTSMICELLVNSEKKGPIAQRLEQGTHNPLVVGSNPTGPISINLDSQSAGRSQADPESETRFLTKVLLPLVSI